MTVLPTASSELTQIGLPAHHRHQLAPREPDARLGRGLAGLGQRRDLFDRIVLDGVEQERDALLGRDAIEQRVQPARELAAGRVLIGRLGGIVGLVGVAHELERHGPPHARAQLVQRRVHGDARDPGLEARLAAIAAEALEGLDERRLHQILEVGRRAGQPRDHPLDVADVRDEELLEAGRLARAAAGDHRRILGGRDRGHGAARFLHSKDGTARRRDRLKLDAARRRRRARPKGPETRTPGRRPTRAPKASTSRVRAAK